MSETLRTATLLEGLDRIGGTQFQCFRLNRALAERGVTTTYVTGQADGPKPEGRADWDVISATAWPAARRFARQFLVGRRRLGPAPPVLRPEPDTPTANAGSRLSPFAVEAVARMLSRRRFDLVHLHGVYSRAMLATAANYARLRRVPLLIKVTNEPERTWATITAGRGGRDLVNTASAVVTVSDGARRFFGERLETRVVHIPNGVELQPPVEPAGRDLLFVGRLIEQKGVDVLLDAWTQVRQAFRRLIILGDGGWRARLEAQARTLGIEDSVVFEGYQLNLRSYYEDACLMVLPSRWEGMPNALLEAMSMGMPCVATRIDGVTDAIDDGVHGVLVSPEDATDLARGLVRLAESEDRRSLGLAARARVEREFTFDAVSTRYRALYDELLSS